MNPRYEHATADDVPALGRILSHAFAGPREGSAEWLQKAGMEHVRVLRPEAGATPPCCLLRIPMGQYFGGRSIPLVGIAGVGVAPEARGRGLAGRMMEEVVREIAAEGVPLSGLYPATQPLYRRVGYEQAGHRFEIRLPLRHVDCRERTLGVRAVQESDQGAIRACYRAFAERFDGPLDRGEYAWRRIEQSWEATYYGFAAHAEDGSIEGYLYLHQKRKPERGRQDLLLSDVAFTTARAGWRLLAFLAEFLSMGDDVTLFGGPSHPLLALLAEQRYRMDLRDHWMIRIISVPAALEARGYRCGSAEVHFEVRDELLSQNDGNWMLRVEGGRASVEKGGRGDLRLGINALASLYSGLRSPQELALLGLCEGSAKAIAAAGAVFAGGTPWMSDMY
jgi:predicted acetyltransferase